MSTARSMSLEHSPNRSQTLRVSYVFFFDDPQDSCTNFAIGPWHHAESYDLQEILRRLSTDLEEVAEKQANQRDPQITNLDPLVRFSIDLTFPQVPAASISMYVIRVRCYSRHVAVYEPHYLQL